MSFETLGGSNAQITKVETQTNSQNIIELDYVAIDFNGVMFEALQYVVPEIYDNQNNIITWNFIYFNLDGTFLDAYRYVDNQVAYRLVLDNNNTAGFAFTTLITAFLQDCDEDLNPNSQFCSDTLDAVVIGGNTSGGSSAYEHPIWFVYQQNPPEMIDAGSSTGSGSVRCPDGQVLGSDSITCHNIPCVDAATGNGDPLGNMEILGTPNNGVEGGRYGNGRGRFHDGVDLQAPFGTPVFATHSGVVAAFPFRNNWSMEEHGLTRGEGAGNRLYLNFLIGNSNVQLGYWHMGEILVQPGQQVTQGQLIGYTGNTGNVSRPGSAGSHLHVRARIDGNATDPEPYFATEFNEQGQQLNNNCN